MGRASPMQASNQCVSFSGAAANSDNEFEPLTIASTSLVQQTSLTNSLFFIQIELNSLYFVYVDLSCT
jgi:hypothetical protein